MSPLPRLLLLADGFAGGREGMTAEAVQERTEAAVRAGLRWVQLRDHGVSVAEFEAAARALAQRLRALPTPPLVSVNTHAEVALALGAGLHVGWRGSSVTEARRRIGAGVLTFAAHTPEEAQRAGADGADAVLFSPVFPTASKPGHAGTGLEALARSCQMAGATPVYALGGVTPERIGACLAAGAYGVAVLSGMLAAPDPGAATQSYLAALP